MVAPQELKENIVIIKEGWKHSPLGKRREDLTNHTNLQVGMAFSEMLLLLLSLLCVGSVFIPTCEAKRNLTPLMAKHHQLLQQL
ncbi:hypothetical protein C4D60_Mb08t08410 [Musa balbisiana]|uniref:Uncharacterized protein n=1 Tax=Musa balbisiana TaxID=52838 RepID=A0A4S8K2B5_MUSBA|nr:hypothetical protein C4D60_Mb08t08410 [Musa balbisiana]